jgi:hypothetical protein
MQHHYGRLNVLWAAHTPIASRMRLLQRNTTWLLMSRLVRTSETA